MKYTRKTAGYTWADYKTDTVITKELHVAPVLHTLQEYKRYWLQYTNRMPRNKLLRKVCKSADKNSEVPGETTEETSRSVRATSGPTAS